MEIYNDDCLKVLEKLKENSIDMVLVDLPYGQTDCKWDCLIDLDKMWKLLKKCCKGNAIMVFFCTTKFGNTLINSNKKGFKYDLVWEKSRKVGFLNANKMPLRKHEMIYVFADVNNDDLDNSRNLGLRAYFKMVHKFIEKPLKSIMDKIGGRANHCFRYNSSQFGLPTQKTYEALIKEYNINEMKGFRTYDDLKKEWGKPTYNPQKTTGHKTYFIKGSKLNNTDDIYGRTETQDTYIDDTRHPHSILQFEEEPTHEMVYVFKGDKPHSTYNPQKTTGHKPIVIKAHKYNNKQYVYNITGTPDYDAGDTRHPHSILKFNNPNSSGGTLHRTQKPVDLCEWLIKSFSNEGDVVCDFTMGSGTTGIACLNTNRKFIGVELDKEIFKIAEDRLNNHNKEDKKEEKKEGITCSCGKVLKKINKRHLESDYHKKNSSK